MTNTVTYHSTNANPTEAWLAYVVLPNGEYWLVRFTGATEQEAIGRAVALYDKELAKSVPDDPWADLPKKGQHLIGKKWAINKVTREKRVLPTVEITALIATGEWEAAGPRSR